MSPDPLSIDVSGKICTDFTRSGLLWRSEKC